LVFSYNKILVPYDSSKPSENALQQAIQLANLIVSNGNNDNNASHKQDLQIILLHVVEQIHIRIPSLYLSLRIVAGKPMKEFYEDIYEEKNDASKMLEDIKKDIESSIVSSGTKCIQDYSNVKYFLQKCSNCWRYYPKACYYHKNKAST
jgi:nucleotide-binding universal stress UspA family protein